MYRRCKTEYYVVETWNKSEESVQSDLCVMFIIDQLITDEKDRPWNQDKGFLETNLMIDITKQHLPKDRFIYSPFVLWM